MSNYLLNIIISFGSMFLTCYLIYWFVGLFHSSNGNKIAFILITLDVILHLLSPIEGLINYNKYIEDMANQGSIVSNDEMIETISYLIVNIIIDIAAYFTFVYLFYAEFIIFKSARAKQFEREYQGKSNFVLYLSRTIMVILALLSLSGAILLFVVSKSQYVIVIGLFLIALTIFISYLFVRTFKGVKKGVKVRTKQDKITNYYFIIITDEETYLFEGNSNKTFKDALNHFDDNYYIDEYGYIYGLDKRIIYGLRVDRLNEDLVAKLDMNRIYNDKLINILSGLDKINQKIITVDEDYNVIKEEKR